MPIDKQPKTEPKSIIRCPYCYTRLVARGSNKIQKGGDLKSYYKCTNPKCGCNVTTTDRAQYKTTITEDGSFRIICDKIQQEIKRRLDQNQSLSMHAIIFDDDELDKAIEASLEAEDFYSIVRQVYLEFVMRKKNISRVYSTTSTKTIARFLNHGIFRGNSMYCKRMKPRSVKVLAGTKIPKATVWKIT